MPQGINLAGGDLPIVKRLRLLARGAKIPAQPIVEESADALEAKDATITALVDALRDMVSAYQDFREQHGAPPSSTCIEAAREALTAAGVKP